MNIEELLAALAAGIIAGMILVFAERSFPQSGVGRV